MEGPMLRKLREGQMIRGPRSYDVTPPEGKSAFRFHPDNLTISLADLKARYDPQVWTAFEQLADSTKVEGGGTLLDWLKTTPEKTTLPKVSAITESELPEFHSLPFSAPAIKRAEESFAATELSQNKTIKSPAGTNVVFGGILRSHIDRIAESSPKDRRARFLPAAIQTISHPVEVWEKNNRRYYLARFDKKGHQGFLVVAARIGEKTDEVITFMPQTSKDIQDIRSGKLIYRKAAL
jgi:hypothetical protein